MMAEIPPNLLRRIAERANDPMRRTFAAGAMATAQPLDLEAMVGGLVAQGHPAAEHLQGMLGNLAAMMGGMGGLQQGLGGMLMAGIYTEAGTANVNAQLSMAYRLVG